MICVGSLHSPITRHVQAYTIQSLRAVTIHGLDYWDWAAFKEKFNHKNPTTKSTSAAWSYCKAMNIYRLLTIIGSLIYIIVAVPRDPVLQIRAAL